MSHQLESLKIGMDLRAINQQGTYDFGPLSTEGGRTEQLMLSPATNRLNYSDVHCTVIQSIKQSAAGTFLETVHHKRVTIAQHYIFIEPFSTLYTKS